MKEFIKDVIAGFNVGFEETHVGAVIFSSSSHVKKVFGLDDYYSREEINSEIDKMRYPSGGTFTGQALTLTAQQIYTPQQDREDKPNVCIVITDGEATDEVETPANELRNAGTVIFAVGVGKNYNQEELEVMAGGAANVYTSDFDKLANIIERIKQSACRGQFHISCYIGMCRPKGYSFCMT